MGVVPPNPGITGHFLTAVSTCTFTPETNTLRDPHGLAMNIVIAQGAKGGSTVEWAAHGDATACPVCLLDHRTFEVITRGRLQDGLLVFEGASYRLVATSIGESPNTSVLCAAVPE